MVLYYITGPFWGAGSLVSGIGLCGVAQFPTQVLARSGRQPGEGVASGALIDVVSSSSAMRGASGSCAPLSSGSASSSGRLDLYQSAARRNGFLIARLQLVFQIGVPL